MTTSFDTIDTDQLNAITGGNAHDLGAGIGFAGGVAVTEALRFVPGWSERRFTPIVGPKINAFADKLGDGTTKRFLTGVGDGATAAPTWLRQREGH